MSTTGMPTVAELYEEHFDFVWRSLRRLGVPAAYIDDAAQDVFIVVQQRLDTFEQRSSVRTWLFGIALRVTRNYRRPSAQQAVNVEDETLIGDDPDPQQAALISEATSIVQTLLDQLDEGRRAVFVLAELEEFTAVEISESLGVGINTVYSRLRLARRDMEAGLRRLQLKNHWRGP